VAWWVQFRHLATFEHSLASRYNNTPGKVSWRSAMWLFRGGDNEPSEENEDEPGSPRGGYTEGVRPGSLMTTPPTKLQAQRSLQDDAYTTPVRTYH